MVYKSFIDDSLLFKYAQELGLGDTAKFNAKRISRAKMKEFKIILSSFILFHPYFSMTYMGLTGQIGWGQITMVRLKEI